MNGRTLRAFALVLMAACSTAPIGEPPTKKPDVAFECYFTEPDHKSEWCLKPDFVKDLLEVQEGVLFYEKDSRIRIKTQSLQKDGRRREPYHAHLIHRLDTATVEQVATQAADGTIEIDLAKFPEPEVLILTSAPMKARSHGTPSPTADREKPLLAPYAIALRLIPAAGRMETILSLQPFRYEWHAPAGLVTCTIQPVNRGDMLVTVFDVSKKSGWIFADTHFYSKPTDGQLVPRVAVEVLRGPSATVWQRAAIYPVPSEARAAAKNGEKPLVFAVPGQDILTFAPPATVELSLLEKDVATSATVAARLDGLRTDSRLHISLAAGYPVAGNDKIGVRVKADTFSAERRDGCYVVSLDDLDPSLFPLTGYLAHRLVEPWRTTGGRYAPAAPLGVSYAEPFAGDTPRLHAGLIAPRYATHYDVVHFAGKGTGLAGETKNFLAALYGGTSTVSGSWSSGSGVDPSSNVLPPPWLATDPTASTGGLGTGVAPGNGTGSGSANGSNSSGSGGGSGGGSGSSAGSGSSDLSPQVVNSTTTLFLGFGNSSNKCTCGPKGVGCPRKPPCNGLCGAACNGNGHCNPEQPLEVTVEFDCVKKENTRGCPKSSCKCPAHGYTSTQIAESLLAGGASIAKLGGLPDGSTPADSGFQGGDSQAACHQRSFAGRGYVDYWGNGWQLVRVWVDVYVTFGPCPKPPRQGNDPKKEDPGKDMPKPGSKKDDPPKKDTPETDPKDGGEKSDDSPKAAEDSDIGAVIDTDKNGSVGRVTHRLSTGSTIMTGRWNPSSDPNVITRLEQVASSLRRPLGLPDLPFPRNATWFLPTNLLFFTSERIASDARIDAAYFGRKGPRSWIASGLSARESLWDWVVYLAASKSSGASPGGGGSEGGEVHR